MNIIEEIKKLKSVVFTESHLVRDRSNIEGVLMAHTHLVTETSDLKLRVVNLREEVDLLNERIQQTFTAFNELRTYVKNQTE